MKHKKLVVLLCLVLTVLLAAAALSGCSRKANDKAATPTASAPVDGSPENVVKPDGSELGEGKRSFRFDVKRASGETLTYTIHTDAETVGAALQGLNLIAGDVGDYGLYVKTVCGETLDYNADGMYWAFYVNGGYAEKGVDQTPITEGATYAFEAAKG